MRRIASWAAAVTAAAVATTALGGCGSDSGSASSKPPYGSAGPASVKALEDCLAGQPDDRKLLRSQVNGSLSADLALVGQGAPTGPLLNTALIENGKVDGVPAAKEIKARVSRMGSALAFEPYRSGSFAVYPVPQVETLGEFQPTVDACLPKSGTLAGD